MAGADPLAISCVPGGLEQPFVESIDTGEHFNFGHAFTKANTGRLRDSYAFALWGSRLGEGAYGTVRQAQCRQTGAPRAIKTISLEKVQDRERLEAEIDIHGQLDHPSVVRLFETFRDATSLHLVLELCSGGDLFAHVSRRAPDGFPEPRAAGYVQQILEAVCYLHARKIAHRDVKPENFLLQSRSQDASLKLVDFGAARRFEPGMAMATQLGTAYYVAPEVLGGSYDERCDVWSAGVVAYVLLCGYPPFRGKTAPAILRRVKKARVQFVGPEWERPSRAAKDFVSQLLDTDLARRPSAREALQGAWLAPGGPAAVPIRPELLERLRAFRQHAVLKQVAVTAMAQQVPDSEIEVWRSTFKALDRDGDGLLSWDEMREGIARQGLALPEEFEETIRSADSDGSGCLDYTEFLAATIDPKLYTKRDICHAAFLTLDLNGDGKISPDELRQLLSDSNGGKSPGDCHILDLLQEVDLNGDGVIDFEEFFAMMRARRSLHYSRRESQLSGVFKGRAGRLHLATRLSLAMARAALALCGCSYVPSGITNRIRWHGSQGALAPWAGA